MLLKFVPMLQAGHSADLGQPASVPNRSAKKPCRPKAEEKKKGVEVTIRYGPYEACGIVEHRLHRLYGMQSKLNRGVFCLHLCVVDTASIFSLLFVQ